MVLSPLANQCDGSNEQFLKNRLTAVHRRLGLVRDSLPKAWAIVMFPGGDRILHKASSCSKQRGPYHATTTTVVVFDDGAIPPSLSHIVASRERR